jgi:two-component system, NtrC family, nitrogen regulation sensor histidine kinase NtrY
MNLRLILKYAVIIFSIFLFGRLTETNILFPRFNNSYVQRFQRVYKDKEKSLNEVLLKIRASLKHKKNITTYDPDLSEYIGLIEPKGFAILIYEHDTLKFWSDNSVPVSLYYSQSGIDSTFLYIKNAWYVPRTVKSGSMTIVGLIQIKQVYQYENKYLVTKFQKDFNAPSSVKISTRLLPNSFPITNSKNKYIFSLVFDRSAHHLLFQKYIPSLSYFVMILLLLWFVTRIIQQIQGAGRRNWIIIGVAIIVLLLKSLMLKLQLPKVFYDLDLFNPQYFASSELIPSLGDLLLWSIVGFFLVFLFYKSFTLTLPAKWYVKRWNIRLMLMLQLLIILGFFSGIFFLINSIILNSTISFEVNKLLLFDLYSLIGYLIIVLLFASFAFYFDKVLLFFIGYIPFLEFNLIFILTCAMVVGLFLITGIPIHLLSVIFVIILGGVLSNVRLRLKSVYKYSTLILIVLLFSIYTVFIVSEYSYIRTVNQKKVLVASLANERDPVAEYLFREKDKEMNEDTILSNLVQKRTSIDINRIYKHLKRRYFEGYLEKYTIQVTICKATDSLYLEPPDNMYVQCFGFFNSMILERGTRLQETDFYYIDNKIGRVNYLGWYKFGKETSNPVSLFIELDTKPVAEILGYPELLLDSRVSLSSIYREYDYAKYYKGQRISEFGTFTYNLSDKVFQKEKEEYASMSFGDHDHLIYRPSKDSLIVLSSPTVTFLDWLISFSYTFVVYFLILTCVVLFINLPIIKNAFFPNFKNKIQYSMMSVLFLSLILIGGGTLFFNVRQYYAKHYAIISEKLKSINTELTNTLAQEQHINSNWHSYPYYSLDELLVRLSNIFYADINLYDPKGNLIATSRPEIFDKGLIGNKINPKAYNSLFSDMKAEIIHHEQIGDLNYISAYLPFKNKDGKLLAFLNLPYFTTQEELTREVSTMVVAAVNMYVLLLMITFLIAVFISQKITMPLRVVQLKFSTIRLGQKYEQIVYDSNDEIGGLVNEYNRMVTELEKSIEMLARSERESAWREMAKQIAHEINNPLTPMKLSVQQLHRAWIDKNERFGEYLDRISKTLIDEIDNLSAIATEFSNFAKMPAAMNQRLDLITKINNAVSLFANDNGDFVVHLNDHNEVFIYADKEQISRVLINLFTNAIQSVAKGIKPHIIINVDTDESSVTVDVKDNGKGIPKEMQEKLFRPNFTTKTSGMGLGLAIVKNIIESSRGSITYTTSERGTTFIITLPLYKEQSEIS